MKTIPIIFIALIAITGACKDKKQETAKPVPTILEGKRIDVSSIIHKKRGADLVEALYEELTTKSEELQELDKQIKALQDLQKNAVDSFKKFDERNKSYYDAAHKKLEGFHDSLVRKKIRHLIAESQADYAKTTQSLTELDNLIRKKNNTINDLYLILKISRTLPLIKEYQQDNLPGTGSMEGLSHHLDSLLQQLDTLSKK